MKLRRSWPGAGEAARQAPPKQFLKIIQNQSLSSFLRSKLSEQSSKLNEFRHPQHGLPLRKSQNRPTRELLRIPSCRKCIMGMARGVTAPLHCPDKPSAGDGAWGPIRLRNPA